MGAITVYFLVWQFTTHATGAEWKSELDGFNLAFWSVAAIGMFVTRRDRAIGALFAGLALLHLASWLPVHDHPSWLALPAILVIFAGFVVCLRRFWLSTKRG